jgi:hypothetical protein
MAEKHWHECRDLTRCPHVAPIQGCRHTNLSTVRAGHGLQRLGVPPVPPSSGEHHSLRAQTVDGQR